MTKFTRANRKITKTNDDAVKWKTAPTNDSLSRDRRNKTAANPATANSTATYGQTTPGFIALVRLLVNKSVVVGSIFTPPIEEVLHLKLVDRYHKKNCGTARLRAGNFPTNQILATRATLFIRPRPVPISGESEYFPLAAERLIEIPFSALLRRSTVCRRK